MEAEKCYTTTPQNGHILLRNAQIKTATGKTRLECFRLVKKEYIRSGYTFQVKEKNNFFENTEVFYAFNGNNISATISVVIDSFVGLPLDKIFKEKIEGYRKAQKKIAEVVMFATDANIVTNSKGLKTTALRLISWVLQYSIKSGIDYLCITVNPKHVRFYKFIGFDGNENEIRIHPGAHAPAVFLNVNIKEWLEKRNLNPTIVNLIN